MAKDTGGSVTGTGSQRGTRLRFWLAAGGVIAIGLLAAWIGSTWHGPRQAPVDAEKILQQTEQARRLASLVLAAGQRQTERDLPGALELAERAVALQPDYVTARSLAGHLAIDLRRYDRAREHFEAILEQQPNQIDAALSLAVLDAMAGEYAEARRRIDEVLPRIEGQNAPMAALYALRAAANMDRPEVADGFIAQAVARESEVEMMLSEARLFGPQLLVKVGQALVDRGDAVHAADAYALAAEQAPTPAMVARFAGRAAELYLAAGEVQAAQERVGRALGAEPDNAQWVLLQDRIRAAADPQDATATQPPAQTPASPPLPSFGLPAQ